MSSRFSATVQRSVKIKTEAEKLYSYLSEDEKHLSLSELIAKHKQEIQNFDSKQLQLIDITPTDLGRWKSAVKKWLRLTNDYYNSREYTRFEEWFLKDISVLDMEDLKHNYIYLTKYYRWPNENSLVTSIKDSIKLEVQTKYNQLKSEYEARK